MIYTQDCKFIQTPHSPAVIHVRPTVSKAVFVLLGYLSGGCSKVVHVQCTVQWLSMTTVLAIVSYTGQPQKMATRQQNRRW